MPTLRCRSLPSILALALSSAPVAAQDLLAVTFPGQVLRIDSQTGATTTLASGQIGKNCLAVTGDNRIWTVVRTGTLPNFQFFLTELDPFTGAETRGTVPIGDIRGLASDGTHTGLWGIRENPGSDQLVRIDTNTSAVTLVGGTGFASLQGFDGTGSSLVAWDLTAGLVRLDANTGVGTDPFPSVGTPTGVQFLARNPVTRELWVGQTTLRLVDELTGTVGAPIPIVGAPDCRGADFTTVRIEGFGTTCLGATGLVRIGADFVAATQVLTIRSTKHAPGSLGVPLIGFRATAHAGQPLPIALDPLLGTQNCALHISIDLQSIAVADAAGILTQSLTIPSGLAFFQFYAQHAAFEPVQGGMSWSHGLRIRLPL